MYMWRQLIKSKKSFLSREKLDSLVSKVKSEVDLDLWKIEVSDSGEIAYIPKVYLKRNRKLKFNIQDIKSPWRGTPSKSIAINKIKAKKCSPYLLAEDLDSKAHEALVKGEKYFNESNQDSYYVVKALIQSKESGIYPPVWALDYLAEELQKCVDLSLKEKHEGLKGNELNKAFGFTGSKGKDNPYKKKYVEEKNIKIIRKVHLLHVFFNINISKASRMVLDWFEKTSIKEREGLEQIDGETIREYYYKYRDKLKLAESFDKLSSQDNEDLISTFPELRRTRGIFRFAK